MLRRRKKTEELEDIKKALEEYKQIEGKKFNYTLSKEDLEDIAKRAHKRSKRANTLHPKKVVYFLLSLLKKAISIYVTLIIISVVISWLPKWSIDIWKSFMGHFLPGEWCEKILNIIKGLKNWWK